MVEILMFTAVRTTNFFHCVQVDIPFVVLATLIGVGHMELLAPTTI